MIFLLVRFQLFNDTNERDLNLNKNDAQFFVWAGPCEPVVRFEYLQEITPWKSYSYRHGMALKGDHWSPIRQEGKLIQTIKLTYFGSFMTFRVFNLIWKSYQMHPNNDQKIFENLTFFRPKWGQKFFFYFSFNTLPKTFKIN